MTTIPNCVGLMAPWAHSENVKQYQLFDMEGDRDGIPAYLCKTCVQNDRDRGYDWRLTEES